MIIVFQLFYLLAFSDETLWQEVKKDLASPFTTEAKVPTYYALGTTLTFIVGEDYLNDDIEERTAKRRPLGRASRYGDIAGQMVPNALYMIGMYTHYLLTDEENSYARAKLMAKSSFYSGMITSVLKVTIREPRPNNRKDRKSFPSGHTASAFAFASVVGAEHGVYYGVGAYSLAALVGFSRMNDNKHYLHDVIAGASLGMMYGLGLYYRKEEDMTSQKPKPEVVITPVVIPEYLGLNINYSF